MTQLLIVVAVAVLAGLIGMWASRRAPDAPVAPGHHEVPTQVDRADFERPATPWLVAVFTAATCDTCRKVVEAAQILDSDQVAVTEIEVGLDGDVHDRYGITAVPLVVIADTSGVVKGSFLGPPSAADLWAKLAEVRAPDPG